jgi:GTP cyclohydrolase II
MCALQVRTRIPLRLRRTGETALLVSFDGPGSGDNVALVFGQSAQDAPTWVRIHSSCQTGDVFGSCRCDCGAQLEAAMWHLERHGGVLLYLQQEGRGIGLKAKIDAYALQDAGLDTWEANRALGFPADAREYRTAANMLLALGHSRVRLLGSNPDKAAQLRACGIEVVDGLPLDIAPVPDNAEYLASKRRRFAQHRGETAIAPREPSTAQADREGAGHA